MVKILTSIVILILLSFSCKKNPAPGLLTTSTTSIPQKTINQKEKEYTCNELIADLVRSSNAAAFKNFKDLQIRINNLTPEKISIELYVSSNISEDPLVKKNVENPVGWLEFFPSAKKLQDITNDPDQPEILKYDISILEKTDLNKLCGFIQNIDTRKDDVKCYRKQNNDYSFKEICEYNKTKDFNYLYNQIPNKFDQNDLLTKLPKKDTVYSTSSTPEIKYSIKKDLIRINITSEGGETVLKIYRTKDKSIIESVKSPD